MNRYNMNLLTVRGGDLSDESIADAITHFEQRVAKRLGTTSGAALRADEAADGSIKDRYDPSIGHEVAAQMWKELGAKLSVDGFGNSQLRADAAGMFFARELEQVDPVILREKYKKLNSMAAGNFPVTTGVVRPGARTYTIRRISSLGKAKIIRNDDTQIPNVGANRKEESFPVIYGAVGISYNVWDEQSADFAGTDLASEFQMTSERALGQLINDVNFNGDLASGVFGILNYPHMARFASATAINDNATADAILAALNRGANFAHVYSGDTFASDTVAMSPRAHAYLTSRYVGAGAPNVTILDAFLAKHATVKNVKVMHELQDSTSARVDKFLFYANEKLALDLMVPQPYVLIPGVPGQLRRSAVAYCSMLGCIQRDTGNNCLMTAVVQA